MDIFNEIKRFASFMGLVVNATNRLSVPGTDLSRLEVEVVFKGVIGMDHLLQNNKQ